MPDPWFETLENRAVLDGKLLVVCGPNPEELGRTLAEALAPGEAQVFFYEHPPTFEEIEPTVASAVGQARLVNGLPVFIFDRYLFDLDREPPFLEELARLLKNKWLTTVIAWKIGPDAPHLDDLPDGLTFHSGLIVHARDLTGGTILKNKTGPTGDFTSQEPTQC